MTTEEDFQRALDEHPDDYQTRLVFADWLQDHGDPRAEGYRALARCRFAPCHLKPTGNPERDHWMFQLLPFGKWDAECLERDGFRYTFDYNRACEAQWFRKFCDGVFGSHHKTRREAEDAAARAFAKLPAERQRELLATEPAGAA